jgi:hypothetical protein
MPNALSRSTYSAILMRNHSAKTTSFGHFKLTASQMAGERLTYGKRYTILQMSFHSIRRDQSVSSAGQAKELLI